MECLGLEFVDDVLREGSEVLLLMHVNKSLDGEKLLVGGS